MSTLSATPAPVVRMTRRERRIERMRTQRIGHATRTTHRTSGTPYEARPGLWAALAMVPAVTR